jgi:hypothetical protein
MMKRLTSTPGSSDDGLWASFQYGLTLSEHGRYHWGIPHSNHAIKMAFKEEEGQSFFWNKSLPHHLRKAIIDIPKCKAPEILNGIHLADWITHGRYFDKPMSFPPSLAREVVDLFGESLPSRCGYLQGPFKDSDITEIVSNLQESISRKKAAGLHFLNQEPWDLFLIGFKEAHCVSHSLWNLIDNEHVYYDATRNLKLGEPIKSIFSHLDEALGELVNAAGANAEIVIFSHTDMRPNGTLDHLFPAIIHQINEHLGEALCSMLPYNDNYGALRINAPKSKKKDIANIVSQRLAELRDIDTQQYVIGRVTFPARESSGKRAELLPDLLCAYTPNLNPQAVESRLLGRIKGKVQNIRMGNHSEGGFLIAAGNKIQQLANNISALEDFAEAVAATLD